MCDMPSAFDAPERLRAAVENAEPELCAIPAALAAYQAAPDVWSIAELLGHLVDSASNNHQRFVRAPWQDDLVFAGYAQRDWVAVQRYAQADWPDLIALWASFNRHLARVMAATPADVRTRVHTQHNLHAIAFRAPAAASDVTLAYVMTDYVAHLEHHLQQIFAEEGRLAVARAALAAH